MPRVGSLNVVIELMGGDKVYSQLQKIKKAGDDLSKPIQVNIGIEQIAVNAEKVNQATTKSLIAQQRLTTETIRTQEAYQRLAEATARAAMQQQKLLDAQKQSTAQAQKVTSSIITPQMNASTTAAFAQQVSQIYAAVAAAQAKAIAQANIAGFKAQQAYGSGQLGAMQSGQLGGLGAAGANAYLQGLSNIYGNAANAMQSQTRAAVASVASLFSSASSGLHSFSTWWEKGIAGITRFSDGLVHAGQIAATFAYRLTVVTAPLDILLAKSFQFSTQLEQSLAKVGTQLDGSLDKIKAYSRDSRDLIIDLQTQYGVSGTDQASALYYLVSSGVEAGQAQRTLPALAKLSAVTQESPAIAAQGLTAALNIFGQELSKIPDEGERATYALEVMFDATRKGRFEFGDFATQFGRSAEQMKMANATFEETSAMLAALSQVFTPSQASTTLNSFAKAFVNPTKEAKTAFDELKISMYDAMGGRRPMIDVLRETMDKLASVAKVSRQQADEYLTSMFGDLRGGRGAMFFVDPNNMKLLDDILSGIKDNTDNIGQAWALTGDTIQTTINKTTGNFLKLGVSLTDRLEPAVKGVLALFNSLFDTLERNPAVVDTLAQVAGFLAVSAPAALAAGTGLMGIGGLSTMVGTLLSPAYMIGLGVAWGEIAPSVNSAFGAISAFGGGLKGVLATVVETSRQLGLMTSEDAFNIFQKMGMAPSIQGTTMVARFIEDLKKIQSDASKVVDVIKKISDAVGSLIDKISRGEGALGFFANVAKGIAGAGGGILNASNPSGIADVMDKAIASVIAAKLLGNLAGGIEKVLSSKLMNLIVPQMNVQAANVAITSAIGGAMSGGNYLMPGGNPNGVSGGVMNSGMGILPFIGTVLAAAGVGSMFNDIVNSESDRKLLEILKSGQTTWEPKFGIAAASGIGGVTSIPNESDFARVAAANGININSAKVDIQQANGISGADSLTQQRQEEWANAADRSTDAIERLREKAFGAADALDKVKSGIEVFISNLTNGIVDFMKKFIPATPSFGTNFVPATPQGYGDYARSAGLQSYLESQYGDLIRYTQEKTQKEILNPLKDVGSAASKTADALSSAAQKITDTIKGFVKDALSATKVTQEDIDAAKNGTYKNRPDEFARRTRAVADGTDPSQYGADYMAQLELAKSKMPGASLSEIVSAFEDRSLFAKMSPEEMTKMWDWDAVVENVRGGIARVVGEFKLMKTAVANVLSDLSTSDLKDLTEALGLSGDASKDSIASKLMGKFLGSGADTKNAIDAAMPSDETVQKVGDFAKVVNGMKDNISVKISIDEAALDKAKEIILTAEKFIQDHLLNYADVLIEITARFTDNSGGGGGSSGGNSDTNSQKATGGYVGFGTYTVGEQGYEYVLPHPMVKWLEKINGGRIRDPNQLQWLLSALARGETETMNQLALWAGGMTGVYTELPKGSDKWISNMKVKRKNGDIQSYGDYMWAEGKSSSGSSSGGGGGGSGGGSGSGGVDLSGLQGSLDKLTMAINRLIGALGGAGRISGMLDGSMNVGTLGGGLSPIIINNPTFNVPNQSTIDSLSRDVRARAAHGYA